MPGELLVPVLPKSSKQPGIPQCLLYSGSRFQGHQKSKGNRYDVEVVLQVGIMKLRDSYFLFLFPFLNTLSKQIYIRHEKPSDFYLISDFFYFFKI